MERSKSNSAIAVEDVRIEDGHQILKFAGPPVDYEFGKKLVQLGFGWDGAREAWIRRIPSIAEVELMARNAMSQQFDTP